LSSATAIPGYLLKTGAVANEQIIKANDVNVYMASGNTKSQARESPYGIENPPHIIIFQKLL